MRKLLAPIAVLILLAAGAAVGHAEGREASAEGWRLFLPEGFRAAPSSVGARRAEQVGALVSSTGVPLSGGPTQRQFVLRGSEGELAVLSVFHYRLIQGVEIPSVRALDLEAVTRTLELTAREIGELEVQRVDRSRINAIAEGIRVVVEERVEGALSEFRFVIVIQSGSVVVVVFEASDAAPFDPPETWKRLLASLRIERPQPGPERWVPMAVGGFGLLILLVVGVYFLRRTGVEPSYAMAIDPTTRPRGEGPPTGSRAADGLDEDDVISTASGLPLPPLPDVPPPPSATPRPPPRPRGTPPPPPRDGGRLPITGNDHVLGG